jgi:hypothetical protein
MMATRLDVEAFRLRLILFDKRIITEEELMECVRDMGGQFTFPYINFEAAGDNAKLQIMLQLFDRRLVTDVDVRNFLGIPPKKKG